MTQAELKEALTYDELTGIFTWNKYMGGNSKAGKIAGYKKQDGYVAIKVNGTRYFAHRLAWLYMTGTYPELIDHEDHDTSNNIFLNLKDVSHKTNMKNASMSKNNKSGYTGVGFDKRSKKWTAYIKIDGKSIYLGSFEDISDAISARKTAEHKHGFHINHGK